MKDVLTICLDPSTRLSLAVADCTSAAAEAARGHLSGPVAATALGEALACAALAGAENSAPDEAVTLRLECPGGPIGGFLAEAAGAGGLRGYTRKKILDDFDGGPSPKPQALYGKSGTAELVRSVPGRVLASGAVALEIPAKGSPAAAALTALYGVSLQRRAVAEAFAFAGDEGGVLAARAILLECPPDGDEDAYARVRAAFAGGAALKALKTVNSLRNLLAKLGIPHAEIREKRPLAFACRCSLDRARAVLAALPAEERAAMAAKGGTIDIYCHFCGKLWQVPAEAAADEKEDKQ